MKSPVALLFFVSFDILVQRCRQQAAQPDELVVIIDQEVPLLWPSNVSKIQEQYTSPELNTSGEQKSSLEEDTAGQQKTLQMIKTLEEHKTTQEIDNSLEMNTRKELNPLEQQKTITVVNTYEENKIPQVVDTQEKNKPTENVDSSKQQEHGNPKKPNRVVAWGKNTFSSVQRGFWSLWGKINGS